MLTDEEKGILTLTINELRIQAEALDNCIDTCAISLEAKSVITKAVSVLTGRSWAISDIIRDN